MYVLGSANRSRRISATASSLRRSGWLSSLSADGRIGGGRRSSVIVDGGRRSGDAGAVVYENGDGAVGGGRCMNVKFSSESVFTTAFGLLMSGSGARYGGRSARRLSTRGNLPAYRTNVLFNCKVNFMAKQCFLPTASK